MSYYRHLATVLGWSAIAAIAVPVGTRAQLIPDNSLGTESSAIVPQPGQQFIIEGGARRGSNLFHSFQEFNIGDTQQVFFANPNGIGHIFTRVTGSNGSEIFGTLGVKGGANLFLINPNGVVFGPNARLDVGGSFFASSAEAIAFPDGALYRSIPTDSAPLLSVNVPIGLQYGSAPGPIAVQNSDLAVKPGQTLALLGGEVRLTGATLRAPGGEIAIAGLSDIGEIALTGDTLQLPASDRADVRLSDSRASIVGEGGGNLAIYTHNLTITASEVAAGIEEGLGTAEAVGGDIYISATDTIRASENSRIMTTLKPNSRGRGGNITIDAGTVILRDSVVVSETLSEGNAGNVILNISQKVDFASTQPFNRDESVPPPGGEGEPPAENRPNRFNTGVSTISREEATGNAGRLILEAPEITLNGRVRVSSETISAGSGGQLAIATHALRVNGGAVVSTLAAGSGDAGDIAIAADTIEVSDRGNSFNKLGGILATVDSRASRGNGGNITIDTRRLTLRHSGIIAADLFSEGKGGEIAIRATEEVAAIGQEPGKPPSQLTTGVQEGGRGDGGNITIETGRLILRDGARINVGTEGIGNSGNLTIRAEERVELSGLSPEGFPSRFVAQTDKGAIGRGGDIVVDTSRLILRDGAQISAATLGESSGGSIFVRAREGIEAIGFLPVRETLAADIDSELVRDESGKRYPSGIFASSPGLGDVNSLAVETGTLSLQQGAQLSVSSQNQGAAGNLRVRADTARLYHSSLSAESIEGTQANIFVVSPDIQLQERSRITTNARGNATGGNITLHTDILTALENSDISANALDNFGGRVIIHARGIVGAEFRPFPTPESDIMASSKLGPSFSGIVEINTPDVNPEAALAVLPDRVWEPMGEMVAGCPADEGNHFAVVGRGGLPEDPRGILRGEVLVQDLRPLPEATDASHVPLPESDRTRYRIPVEARGWIVNDRGAIELIAHRAASGLFPRLTCERGR